MSKLLINENPLILLPSLAVALGNLNKAVILQQIHYWISDTRAPEREGRRWHFATFSEWNKQFPWLSLRWVKKMFSELEEAGLLITEEFNAHKGDRTKWYTIDYEVLESIELQPKETDLPLKTHSAESSPPSCRKFTTVVRKVHDLYKEEETNKETNKEKEKNKTKKAVTPEGENPVLENFGGESPEKRASQKGTVPSALSSKALCSLFLEFWSLYPKKKGKGGAELAFKKALKVVEFDSLMTHLRKQLEAEKLVTGFKPAWPYPQRWLNEKRWNDEVNVTEQQEVTEYNPRRRK